MGPHAVCSSACGLIWLAGKPRVKQATAAIGFHAAFVPDGQGIDRENGLSNALIGSYMTRLDLGVDAIMFATAAGPGGMAWITPQDGTRYGIPFEVVDEDLADLKTATGDHADASSEALDSLKAAMSAARRAERPRVIRRRGPRLSRVSARVSSAAHDRAADGNRRPWREPVEDRSAQASTGSSKCRPWIARAHRRVLASVGHGVEGAAQCRGEMSEGIAAAATASLERSVRKPAAITRGRQARAARIATLIVLCDERFDAASRAISVGSSALCIGPSQRWKRRRPARFDPEPGTLNDSPHVPPDRSDVLNAALTGP